MKIYFSSLKWYGGYLSITNLCQNTHFTIQNPSIYPFQLDYYTCSYVKFAPCQCWLQLVFLSHEMGLPVKFCGDFNHFQSIVVSAL